MKLFNQDEHALWTDEWGRPTRLSKGCAAIGAACLVFIVVAASVAVYIPRGDDGSTSSNAGPAETTSPTPTPGSATPPATPPPGPALPGTPVGQLLTCGGETTTVDGSVEGLTADDSAVVLFGNDASLQSKVVTAQDNTYNFTMNGGDGSYFTAIQAVGYTVQPAVGLKTQEGCLQSTGTGTVRLLQTGAKAQVSLKIAKMTNSNTQFKFHWEEDSSRAGYTEGSAVLEPAVIELDNNNVTVPDLQAAEKLAHDYNVVLRSEVNGPQWNAEHAYRLLQTFRAIPQPLRSPYKPQDRPASVWTLVEREIDGSLAMPPVQSGPKKVEVSASAFTYASPLTGALGGVRGVFFSKRLHHAVTNFVTNFGQDINAVDKIMRERFGCSVVIPQAQYANLTTGVTNEDYKTFQQFKATELVTIAAMFEEMPSGYHKIKGLQYLLRRRDGLNHPIYPATPAVAWTDKGYIEFMESAFTGDIAALSRLVIHEKSHFLWAQVFSEQIKQEWIGIGGWRKDPNDPDGWSTNKTTEFVSAYAHKKNPNEDMAESLAFFIMQPNKLESRAPEKYEFVRNRIMFGIRYIATIREDLTFQVLNLFPDYTYPGKIKRVDITVDGAGPDEKVATVELELHVSKGSFSAASKAALRVTSEIGTFKDCQLYPQGGRPGTTGHILTGTMRWAATAKKGLWATDQITVTDEVGNQRFEGQSDFGWKLYLNNPNEDVIEPQYVPNSMKMRVYPGKYDQNGTLHDVQYLEVLWEIVEDRAMYPGDQAVYTAITNPSSGKYRLERYGTYNAATKQGNCTYVITEYHPSGTYQVDQIRMFDSAENIGTENFAVPPATQAVTTSNPDLIPPEVDINTITIKGVPARPEAPDGETFVTITYSARDDKSGLGRVKYRLLDPQGISHENFHYHENFNSYFFVGGDPTAWKEYTIQLVLPVGSAPGVWGLQTLEVLDLVGNKKSYSFTEQVQFSIEDDKTKPAARSNARVLQAQAQAEDLRRQEQVKAEIVASDSVLYTAAQRRGKVSNAHRLHDGTLRVE